MGNGTSARVGNPSARGGGKSKGAAKRLSKQEEELRRRRALQAAELARDAERRRNGGAAPVRTEKPASPAGTVPLNSRRKRSTKVTDARGRTSYGPFVKNSNQGRVRTPVKVASAYMRLTPEEIQRERRRREAREKKEAERLAKKKAAQAAKKPGTGRRRTT